LWFSGYPGSSQKICKKKHRKGTYKMADFSLQFLS
jgi:hypothetical protein